MGLKNRILRRDDDSATPIADDATAQHPLPAPVEPATQGDAPTAIFEPVPEPHADAATEPGEPDHAPQGDGLPSAQAALVPLPARRPGFRERGRLRRRLRF